MPGGYGNAVVLNALAKGYDPLEREEKFLDLQLKKQRFSGIEEDADWERARRRLALENQPYKSGEEALQELVNNAPLVTYQNYPVMAERAIRRGVPRAVLPDPQSFRGEEDFNVWKERNLADMKTHLAKLQAEGKSVSPLSDIGKLQHDRELLIKNGFSETHPAVRAIDEEMKKKSSSDERSQTEEQLTNTMLYDPDPQKRERAKSVLAEMEKRKLRIAEAQKQFSNPEPFKKWSPEEKEFWFESKAKGGESPRFGFGDRESYSLFNKEYASWQKGRGVSGGEATAVQAETKALRASLQVQERSYGMMSGFVGNLGKQVDRLGEITKDVKRFDTRLLNIPLVALRTRVKGTPYENIIDMYVTEISTEMGKIASGASASIAELTVATREKWEKIHDSKLSINDLISVMKETKHAAELRTKSAKEAIDETRRRIVEGSTEKSVPSKMGTSGASSVKSIPSNSVRQLSDAELLQRLGD